jgi:hypothetical protein
MRNFTPAKRNAAFSFFPSMFFLLVFASFQTQAQNAKASWLEKWTNPKAFIESRGQFNNANNSGDPVAMTRFAVDDGPTMYYFSKKGIDYKFVKRTIPNKDEMMRDRSENEENEKIDYKTDAVSLTWEGANQNVEIIAEELRSDYFNYTVKGAAGERNINNVRGYKKLIYKNLYPFIDVEYTFHSSGEGIKYAIILHPGADVSQVKMRYSNPVSISFDGSVHIPILFGNIIDHSPLTYYNSDQSTISSNFKKENGNTVSFQLGSYDKNQTVIIDPWTVTITNLPNSNRIWETETDGSGNVYILGGDSYIKLRKFNSSGTQQWQYQTPWDTANYWIGSMLTDAAGISYITSGSNGEISKITAAGGLSWHNNPNGFFGPLFEYWHLSFNCDYTKLAVGGMRAPSPFDINGYTGVVMDLNLSNGAILSYKVVGYNPGGFLPKIQEVSSMCSAPNGNYYFLTLDTIGSIKSDLSTINFRIPSTYNFNYYIPSYGATKLGISAIAANANYLYTHNGVTIDRRDLTTGAVLGSAAIPGGISTSSLGSNLPGNSGLDLDNCGNVYVGSGNQVIKYDANLNVVSTAPTAFAVYDVDVNNNGEVIAVGYSGGTGYVQSLSLAACAQFVSTCTVVPLRLVNFNVGCIKNKRIFNWTTATELNNNYFTIEHSKDGISFSSLGTVRGAGNSNVQINYHSTFSEIEDGYKYYRLKQTDFDNQFSYSNIAYTDCSNEKINIIIYPVPAGNVITVKSDYFEGAEIRYDLYDAKGRVVKSSDYFKVNSNNFNIDISTLPPSAYFIRIKTKESEMEFPVQKFLKTN